jgi:hypothetical protein
MENSKLVATPMLEGLKLTKSICPKTEDEKKEVIAKHPGIDYRQIVGSLIYLQLTRPDIAFAVNMLSRMSRIQDIEHNIALKLVLRYLKETLQYGLLFKRSDSPELTLTAYTDSDWAGDLDNFRSTSGHVVLLNGNPIAFGSKQQSCTALSSCEAETVAMSIATSVIIPLRSVLSELGFEQSRPTTLYCDNTGAISYAEDEEQNSKMRHIKSENFSYEIM